MLLGGFDVIYDCVGSARTLQDSLRWARARGTVVLAGIKFAPMRVGPLAHLVSGSESGGAEFARGG